MHILQILGMSIYPLKKYINDSVVVRLQVHCTTMYEKAGRIKKNIFVDKEAIGGKFIR